MEIVILTEEILQKGKSKNGAWSSAQLRLLGITEIRKGWKLKILGQQFSQQSIQEFIDLKDKHLEKTNPVDKISITDIFSVSNLDEIILTHEILAFGKSKNGGWSAAQLATLGIAEIRRGWKRKIIGSLFTKSTIQRFLFLKNKHLEKDELPDRQFLSDSLFIVNSDMSFEEQYKHPKWLDLRDIILERDEYKCQICSNSEGELHVHHLMYPKNKFVWEIDQNFLIVVCKECHETIHNRQLNARSSA
jgi:hypothetical protein